MSKNKRRRDIKLSVIGTEGPAPWYAQGLCFSCTQCGNCCTGGPGYVWISDEEVARLAEYLKITAAEVVERYCHTIGGRRSLKEQRSAAGEYDCIFLRQEGDGAEPARRVCSVYPARPLQCRTWPFWQGNLASPEAWAVAAQKCPGIGRGKPYQREQIESLRDATDWPGR